MRDGPAWWLRFSAVLLATGLFLAAAKWMALDLHDVAEWLAPHRHAWYALPVVMLAFILLALLPVMLLIAATGIAFGPVLGRCTRWLDAWRARRSASRSAGGWGASASSNSAVSGLSVARETQRHARRLSRAQGAGALHARQHRGRGIDRRLSGLHRRHAPRHGRHRRRACRLRISADASVPQSVPDDCDRRGVFVGVPLTLAWFINRALRSATEAE